MLDRSYLPNADGGHHAARDALAAKAEEKVRAAGGAESRGNNIFGGHARSAQNRAIGCDQIQVNARRRGLMTRRPHGEPRKPIRIVIAASERIERALKPFPRIRKFRRVFCRDFRSDFETTLADPGPECGDHVSRACPKFHLHAPKRFFSDALERAAPSGMNGRDRTALFVSERESERNQLSALPAGGRARL